MIFGLFGARKASEKDSVANLLVEFAAYQQISGLISKAQSLQRLNRHDEAKDIFQKAEAKATEYVKQYPNEKQAHILLALVYIEAGVPDVSVPIIERVLAPGAFRLGERERQILEGQLQKIKRERPLEQRGSEGPGDFTQVYSCKSCGRLHNLISVPCPHCDWFPGSIEEMAQSIVLSNPSMTVPALLLLAREVANGREASEVVVNLTANARAFLAGEKTRKVAEQIFSLLQENKERSRRSLGLIRECGDCGERILLSSSDNCEKCAALVRWPEAIRLLVCLDNLLWLFEQRIEVSSREAFAEFVSLLVAMTSNLLRKQETPSEQFRQYAIRLLRDIGALSDLNRGAIVDVNDPHKPQIYLVKDQMREDSETFGIFSL